MSIVSGSHPVRLGLRANAGQFSLLIGVNALVGGMVGQERTVLPLLARDLFGLTGISVVLLAAVADVADPNWRGSAIGVYRLWRDLGFAVGAAVTGIVADAAGMPAAIWAVALLTAASGLIVLARMRETRPRT